MKFVRDYSEKNTNSLNSCTERRQKGIFPTRTTDFIKSRNGWHSPLLEMVEHCERSGEGRVRWNFYHLREFPAGKPLPNSFQGNIYLNYTQQIPLCLSALHFL